jgi:hypothetical protein
MPLLNYTTSVAAHKTVAEIQRKLVGAGARSILADYDQDGRITGLSFMVDGPIGRRSYTLPVNADSVLKVMSKWGSGVPNRYQNAEQAERVAWRILKDWIEAQLAIVETQMTSLDQVMLPYMHTDATRTTTVYELFRSGTMGELEAGDDD